jgi:exodeoxyribonuclease VII small subunit
VVFIRNPKLITGFSMAEQPAADASQSFESSLAQLQQIVHDLEEGHLGLEVSLLRYEEGIRLLRGCFHILEQAEQRIEIVTGQDAAGNPVTGPFDSTATFEGGEKPAKKPGRRRGAAKTEPPANDGAPEAETDAPKEGGLF